MKNAFKTLVSPWVALVCGVPIVVNNVQRWGVYEGEFLWAVDMQAIAIFLTGPILTAAVAVDAARLSQPGNRHLVLLNPRVYRQYWYVVAWSVGVVLVAYLAALIAVAVGVVAQVGFLSNWQTALLQIICHIAWIFFYCCLGTLIGRFFSPLVAGLAGVVLGVAVLNTQSVLNTESFSLMQIGGASFSRLGMHYNPAYLGWQILLFVVLGLGALLVPVRAPGQHLRPSVGGYLIIAGVIVGLFAPLPALPTQRWVLDAQPPTQCVTDTVELCTYAEHPGFQDRTRARLAELATGAEKGGFAFALPAQVVQSSHGYSPTLTADPLVLSLPHDDQDLDLRTFTTRLYHADHCEARSSEGDAPWLENYFTELDRFAYTVDYHATGYWETGVEPLDSAGVQDFMERYVACDFS